MRLTLRTLLAYLDDTLDPAQAKMIGQKVAESDTAQELIARIKQVTRRRRLTTPPDNGPGGKIDANTVAEYLDNTLDADQLADVEQTALASDVHLAEIAACHQILTLVLGEPALIPPTARQRMYAVAKGREAIPFRKPPPRPAREQEPVEAREIDETLRMGLPPLRSKDSWRNRMVVLGGALALVLCLGVAIWQLMRGAADDDGPRRDKNQVASLDRKKGDDGKKADAPDDKKGKDKVSTDGAKTDGAKTDGTKTDDGKKGDGAKADGGKTDGKDKLPLPVKQPGDFPQGPPSAKEIDLARFEAGKPGTDLLVQDKAAGQGSWVRFERGTGKGQRVYSGRPLVSLPGFRSKVLTDSGVRLTLAGSMVEFSPVPPLFESSVVLHLPPEGLDADLTLGRGRILLTNTKDSPARVRVRFENTTDALVKEMWDITLESKDAEVLIDRWATLPRDEPFFPDPKDPQRKGPVTQVGLVTMNGAANVRVNEVSYGLSMPGPALLFWNSRGGLKGPERLKDVPAFLQPDPPLPKGAEGLERLRDDMRRAAKLLNGHLLDVGDRVDTGVMKALTSGERYQLKLGVRCYAALDMLDKLTEALTDPNRELRLAAVESLRYWCGLGRDNTYRIVRQLTDRNSKLDSQNIVSLLHSFPPEALQQAATYDLLIDNLTNRNLAIRELAAWHLYQLVPEAKKINYDPGAPAEFQKRAQAEWRKLVPQGKLPPMPKAPPG